MSLIKIIKIYDKYLGKHHQMCRWYNQIMVEIYKPLQEMPLELQLIIVIFQQLLQDAMEHHRQILKNLPIFLKLQQSE